MDSQSKLLGTFDTAQKAEAFKNGQPFPWVCIDDFLAQDFAREIGRSYPDWADAERLGRTFNATNERRKIQITDPNKFPDPVKRLAELCQTPEFLQRLSDVTGIPDLLWDNTYSGGGMHQTAAHGRLDVHVDFNRLETNGWYRRINLLLYLNDDWKDEWGGRIELWDRDVKVCHHSLAPVMNRCVIFATSEISFHGVTALTCPSDVVRRSFALYFYTKEPPPHRVAGEHTTIFRARPDEHLKRLVLMPAEKVRATVQRTAWALKQSAQKALGRVRGS